VSPTPGPFVDEARGSSEFYSNKLLVQYRHDQSEVGKLNVSWVQAWNTFLKELRVFIKNYHTTELSWNPQGGDVSKATVASAPASSSGGPPPPPAAGPPPPPAVDLTPPAGGGGPSGAAALFAEINAVKERQAGGKTEGLKHVTKDMKTKNIKEGAPVVASKAAPKLSAAKPVAKLGPPIFELDGQKWKIENQVGNQAIVIDNPDQKQTVYIYKCQDSVVQIKGKVNSIMIDSCKKVGVVFENAISVAEVVNCTSIQVQCTGKVPSVAVDKTSGCQVYLSAQGLETEIVTSKSDEMNVVIPGLNPNDDIVETPIPEQFRTIIKDRKLVTEAVSHAG